jgi:hypothetical protein
MTPLLPKRSSSANRALCIETRSMISVEQRKPVLEVNGVSTKIRLFALTYC